MDHVLNDMHDASEDKIEHMEGEIFASLHKVRHSEVRLIFEIFFCF